MSTDPLKSLDVLRAELDAAEAKMESAWPDLELPGADVSLTLPEGWVSTTLGEFCEVNPSKPSPQELPDDSAISFVPMAAVDADLGAIVDPETRTAGEVRKRFRGFRDGDVLMAKITPSMENGKAAVASDLVGGYGFGSTEFHVLRPFGGVLSEYVFFFVRRQSFRDEARAQMKGKAGQKRVPVGFLEGHAIPLGPPAAQVRAVARLQELGAQRNSGAKSLAAMLPLIEDFRAGVLGTGSLGGFAVSGVSKLSEEASTDLPSIPEDWQWTTIGEVAERLQYGTSVRSAADAGSGVPNVGMGNMSRGKINMDGTRYVELSDEDLETFRLVSGDVLFNRTNSPELVGKAALVEDSGNAVFASYLIRIQLDRSSAHPSFVTYWINSPWGREWAGRVKSDAIGQSNINSRKLAAMPLPLPPLTQQVAISDEIADLFARADELEGRIRELQRRLDGLWETSLEWAFVGGFELDAFAAAGKETAPDQINRAGVERKEERKARQQRSRLQPRRGTRTKPSDRVEEAAAALAAGGFTFDDLRRRLDLPYDELVALLFDRLEDSDSELGQKFDPSREEMLLTRSQR